jgi:hypothetical protein
MEQPPDYGPDGAEGFQKDSAAVFLEVLPITHIIGIIDEACKVNLVRCGKILNFVERPYFIPFIWWIGDAMRQVQNFHFRIYF